jgi:hypothetical protein
MVTGSLLAAVAGAALGLSRRALALWLSFGILFWTAILVWVGSLGTKLFK